MDISTILASVGGLSGLAVGIKGGLAVFTEWRTGRRATAVEDRHLALDEGARLGERYDKLFEELHRQLGEVQARAAICEDRSDTLEKRAEERETQMRARHDECLEANRKLRDELADAGVLEGKGASSR